MVIVPVQSVNLNGKSAIGWVEIDPLTGETISVLEDGDHGTLEYAILAGVIVANVGLGGYVGLYQYDLYVKTLQSATQEAKPGIKVGILAAQVAINVYLGAPLKAFALIGLIIDDIFVLAALIGNEPQIGSILSDLMIPPVGPPNVATVAAPLQASVARGSVVGAAQVPSVLLSNGISASWRPQGVSAFQASTLSRRKPRSKAATGRRSDRGTVPPSKPWPQSLSLAERSTHRLGHGAGQLSFYGPAESNLGVSGNWDNYSATVTGNVSITSDHRRSHAQRPALPAGTYTITTASATLAGSGPSTSPNFSGSASITATGGTVNLGPGSGNVTVGGNPLDPTNGATLTGYTGSITVSANGNNTDSVTLNGNAANVLQVSASPATLTTDQNTPVTFQTNVQTSFADTYTLTAQAPPGWTVTIDNNGNVTATPAPGLQGGTYPIQIIAQSTTNPDLVAQSVVNVTITPTQPGMTLAVQPDTLFTVPFQGAQLPTAFRAVIHNSGPTADTYNLTFHRPRRVHAPEQRDDSDDPGRTDGDRRHLSGSERRPDPLAGD